MGDDEFELVVGGEGEEFFEDFGLEAVLLVGLGEAAVFALPRGGVGELGGDAHQVAEDVGCDGAGGFDGDVVAEGLDAAGELGELFHDHGFAAGEDDVARGLGGDVGEDLVDREIVAFGVPGGVGRVTPGAAKIAAAGTDEDGGNADELSFALDGVKEFGGKH